MSEARFRGYIDKTLVPALKPGDTVVHNNLPAARVNGIHEGVAEAEPRVLDLQACLPDFNPIELVFAKIKAILRADTALTVSELKDTRKQPFKCVSTAECRKYLEAAGYDAYDPT